MATKIKQPANRKQNPAVRARRRVVVLVATRKGAWLYHGDAARKNWRADGPHFLGHVISHLVVAPRDGRPRPAGPPCGRRASPATSDRRCFVRPIAAAPGRKPRGHPRSPKPRTARRAARSITRSGSRRLTPVNRTSGTPGPRRR